MLQVIADVPTAIGKLNCPISLNNGLVFLFNIDQDVAWHFDEVIERADNFMNFFIGALLD